MIEIEYSAGSKLMSMFFHWAIDLGVNPALGIVDSQDARLALSRIGIEPHQYDMIDGCQNDTRSYVVLEFHDKEAYVMTKLAFPRVKPMADVWA